MFEHIVEKVALEIAYYEGYTLTHSVLILTLLNMQMHFDQKTFKNIVAKREIAHDNQFIFFASIFFTRSSICLAVSSKVVCNTASSFAISFALANARDEFRAFS